MPHLIHSMRLRFALLCSARTLLCYVSITFGKHAACPLTRATLEQQCVAKTLQAARALCTWTF
eukprot:678886-Amphidinium_carterae.1